MIAAVVPAAGHSQRMGRPKLTLEIDGRTVISRLVTALIDGGASPVIVVAPPADAPGSMILVSEAKAAGAEVVTPEVRPADMRASVEHALRHLGTLDPPPPTVLLAPADSPGITAELVRVVAARARESPGSIVVPVAGARRGHPVAFPWRVVLEVGDLPEGVGLNALLALHEGVVVVVDVDDPSPFDDLDTPEDYARWGGGDRA